MAGDYTMHDPEATDHFLQIGEFNPADGDAISRPGGLRGGNSVFGYCAYCGWSVGAQSTTRAVRRAYDRHLVKAERKNS
jgi:hypothetical protein